MVTINTNQTLLTLKWAGLGGSVGCDVWLETRRSPVQLPPRSATFFCGDWSGNIFNGYSLPSADSRRAVVSFWQKNVHNTGWLLRGLSLPSKLWLGKLTALDMTPLGWLGRKTSTQTNKHWNERTNANQFEPRPLLFVAHVAWVN